MGEVVPGGTSPTLHPPSPPTVHQCVVTSIVRVTSNHSKYFAVLGVHVVMIYDLGHVAKVTRAVFTHE